MSEEEGKRSAGLPHVNARPLLIAGMGLMGGISLYSAVVLHAVRPVELAVFVLFLLLFFVPVRPRRILCVLGVFLVLCGVGFLGTHAAVRAFAEGPPAGRYEVTGIVQSASVGNGHTRATLSELTFDGVAAGGAMEARLPGEDVRPGDRVVFTANVSRTALPPDDPWARSALASDSRYSASPAACVVDGRGGNVFLWLNGALYDRLHAGMERDTANIAYALLTGNSRAVDTGFLEEARTGGIAHIFAVSGLHIGLLYGAVTALLRPLLRRWSFVPATAAAACYCALCGFTVSSVRALIMCAVAGTCRFFGRKYDLLSSLSFAALLTLLFSPARLFSAAFQLSYGAVAGIALFSEPVTRGLRRLRVPEGVAAWLVSGVSVQLFTFPIMLGTFGYFSVWGTVLNLVLIPVLPALFLPLVGCSLLALAIPSGAGVLLALPEGLLNALLYLFSVADFSAVLAGFSLGAGGAVWLAASLPLGGRVRLSPLLRGTACACLALIFSLAVYWENAVIGCRIDVYATDRGGCALVRSGEGAVLIVDGDLSLSACEDFLRRSYGGEADAVLLLDDDPVRAANTAAFLPAAVLHSPVPIEVGLPAGRVQSGTDYALGDMVFRYEGPDRLTLTAGGCVVEICFAKEGVLDADFFVGGGRGYLKYTLEHGIIKEI